MIKTKFKLGQRVWTVPHSETWWATLEPDGSGFGVIRKERKDIKLWAFHRKFVPVRVTEIKKKGGSEMTSNELKDLYDIIQNSPLTRFSESCLALIQAVDQKSARIKRLEEALESIAKNGCCDKCQEAKLVAIAALEGK